MSLPNRTNLVAHRCRLSCLSLKDEAPSIELRDPSGSFSFCLQGYKNPFPEFDLYQYNINRKNSADTKLFQNPTAKRRRKHFPCAGADVPHPS